VVRSADIVDYLTVDSLKINVNRAGWGTTLDLDLMQGIHIIRVTVQFGIQARDLGMIK
jgi:hypothetical protein